MLKKYGPIVIQGALPAETDYLIDILEYANYEDYAGFRFHVGKINDIDVVVSKTDIGEINAATATVIAIMKYKPRLLINQGCAGACRSDLRLNDIVVANKIYYSGIIMTPESDFGHGSCALDWEIASLSNIDNFSSMKDLVIDVEPAFYEKALNVSYFTGRLYCGAFSSSDIWNREKDRIVKLSESFGAYCEEMESFAVARVCKNFKVPFLAFRVISNNHLVDYEFKEITCLNSQKFSETFVNTFLKSQ